MTSLAKVWRFARLYGPGRTAFKIAGRTRQPFPLAWRKHDAPDIALIGCGQYGFATLGYFLTKRFGRRIRWCYDIVPANAKSLSKTLGAEMTTDPGKAMADPDTKYVYIASNHASHTDYALEAMAAGKDVFVEKPVAVSQDQFQRLRQGVKAHDGRIFAGYNRPFSGAVRQLAQDIDAPESGLSLSCFVSGHMIGPDHWYRNPEEGTRICGNAGHWIDLFVHVMAWRGLPDEYRIQFLAADKANPDDDFALTISTDRGDIFTLMLTARNEPFEGINETVNLQWGETIAKIDDFRRMTVWRGTSLKHHRFRPKDVGHRAGALQPFAEDADRDWSEVEASTILMLRVMEMTRTGEQTATLSLAAEFEKLDSLGSSS